MRSVSCCCLPCIHRKCFSTRVPQFLYSCTRRRSIAPTSSRKYIILLKDLYIYSSNNSNNRIQLNRTIRQSESHYSRQGQYKYNSHAHLRHNGSGTIKGLSSLALSPLQRNHEKRVPRWRCST